VSEPSYQIDHRFVYHRDISAAETFFSDDKVLIVESAGFDRLSVVRSVALYGASYVSGRGDPRVFSKFVHNTGNPQFRPLEALILQKELGQFEAYVYPGVQWGAVRVQEMGERWQYALEGVDDCGNVDYRNIMAVCGKKMVSKMAEQDERLISGVRDGMIVKFFDERLPNGRYKRPDLLSGSAELGRFPHWYDRRLADHPLRR
jgi:hypothetical protein